jgi:uncharacterized protein YndB with AHSA1/START domain
MMNAAASFKLFAQGERELVLTRDFKASASMVFDAMTKPELIKRWCGVFDKNYLESCEVDLRVGGKFRYVWRVSDGSPMGMSGVFLEIEVPRRLVHTELFDEAWYPGEARVTNTFIEQAGITTFKSVSLYESREARDAVLSSPMERGVRASYDKLEAMLQES